MIQVIEQVNIENKENKEERLKKYKYLFIQSNFYNCLISFFISICGYLSMPNGGVDIITERKVFWSKDIIMTIIRLLSIPMSISKIIINLNIFKEKFISFFNIRSCGCKQKILLMAIILIIASFCSSLYQNIVFYTTFIGGLITIPAFFIPPFLYKYYYNFETKNC